VATRNVFSIARRREENYEPEKEEDSHITLRAQYDLLWQVFNVPGEYDVKFDCCSNVYDAVESFRSSRKRVRRRLEHTLITQVPQTEVARKRVTCWESEVSPLFFAR